MNLNAAMSQEKIKIGLLIPMTGLDKELGESIIKAVRLAVKDVDSDVYKNVFTQDAINSLNSCLY